jgi:8-oxo-dGTP pyrophosphatase MutT (NUDIX family)
MEESQQKIFSAGVFALVFNKDFSKIFLLKRNEEKRKKYGYDWGNPGGVLEAGEFSVDGAIREAWEETGLKLDKSKMKLLETIENPNWSAKYHSFHFVYGISIDENEKVIINGESDDFGWFDINNLPDKTIDSKEDILRWREMLINNLSPSFVLMTHPALHF